MVNTGQRLLWRFGSTFMEQVKLNPLNRLRSALILLVTTSLTKEIELILDQSLIVICKSLKMPRVDITRCFHQRAIRSVMSACSLNPQSSKISLLANYVLSLLHPTVCGSFLCLLCCINLLTCSPTSYSFSSQVSLCQLLATSGE